VLAKRLGEYREQEQAACKSVGDYDEGSFACLEMVDQNSGSSDGDEKLRSCPFDPSFSNERAIGDHRNYRRWSFCPPEHYSIHCSVGSFLNESNLSLVLDNAVAVTLRWNLSTVAFQACHIREILGISQQRFLYFALQAQVDELDEVASRWNIGCVGFRCGRCAHKKCGVDTLREGRLPLVAV
jgi:hypothetical protein